MEKLTGNLRITMIPASGGVKSYFEVVFIPYAGRFNTKPAKASNYEELVTLLKDLKFDEDEATRWSGRVRTHDIVLIDSVERNESILRQYGLIA